MSYILDALRRADAERQQGELPGLNSTFEPPPLAAPRPARPAWQPLLLWGLGGLTLAAAAGATWWWWPHAPDDGPARRAAVPPVVASPVSPAPVPAVEPVPLPMVVSAPSPAASEPVSGAGVAPPVPMPPPMPMTSGAMPGAMPGVMPPPAPAAPAVAARATPIDELPESQRRELPPLEVGGSVWSDSPPSRFVILDGQVLREGDQVAPGLLLERIQRKSVILRWRDQRLELGL